MRTFFLLPLLFVFFTFNVSAQSASSRLSSIVNTTMTSGSFVPTDSTYYSYTDPNTSHMKTGIIAFDYAITQTYNSGSYKNYQKVIQAMYLDSIRSDQTELWNDTTGNWGPPIYSVNTIWDLVRYLDTQKQVSSTPCGDCYIENYYYDASNNIIRALRFGLTFDTTGQILYTYNASNGVTSSIAQKWIDPLTSFENISASYYYYDGSNNDTMRVDKVWNKKSAAYTTTAVSHFYYDGSNRLICQTFTPVLLGATGPYRDSFMYNSHNNVNTSIHQTYDSVASAYNNVRKTDWTYDATYFDNPLTKVTASWNSPGWVSLNGQDVFVRYHYDTGTTYISNVNNVAVNFELFPQPAQTILNLRMKWNEPQPFTVAIYDMYGRLIKQFGEKATTNYQKGIFVADLPSGNYMIQVRGKDTHINRQFSIAK